MNNTAKLKIARKEIARMKTILGERQRAEKQLNKLLRKELILKMTERALRKPELVLLLVING